MDCAFTERAKKKVKQQKKAVRRGGEDEKDEEAHEELPPPRERGVIYLGHIPYGFFEDEMRSYFSQFGTVTRLKLYRSRKVSSCSYTHTHTHFPVFFHRLEDPEVMLSWNSHSPKLRRSLPRA